MLKLLLNSYFVQLFALFTLKTNKNVSQNTSVSFHCSCFDENLVQNILGTFS
jgi:hypothetical protein